MVWTHLKQWYARFERPISSLSLIGGFLFDAVTLKRVDMFWENFWVVAHLLIVATCIVWINKEETALDADKNPDSLHFWLVNIMQFFFGGILSTYLVYYFRSGTLSVSWPFILLLTAAFIANERLKSHYTRLRFQMGLLYLSIFAFCIFIIPVIIHQIGVWVFLLSGIASLVCMGLFLLIFSKITHQSFKSFENTVLPIISMVFGVITLFYFLNVIPPIPLSLQDAGVFHRITKTDTGYITFSEQTTWKNIFIPFDPIHIEAADPVYVYSSVFSPPQLNTTIMHVWQYFDPTERRWVTEGAVPLPLIGGRESGFRTYSIRSNLLPGNWRVLVQTEDGLTIGTIRFKVISGTFSGNLQTEIK